MAMQAAERLRALLAAERGTLRIIPPADCQIALVYPNTYAVGMSSLGYQMVYRWINDHPAALAERFFSDQRSAPKRRGPTVREGKEGQRRDPTVREGRLPALSLEHQRPLDAFDLIAFSIAYELDYIEAVRFLLAAHIHPRAADRDPRAEPIILAGGICLSVNRLPIYDMVDLFVLGDGEGIVPRLLDAWREAESRRPAFLEAAARIEGVEVTEGARRRFQLALPAIAADDPNRPPAPAPHVAPALETTDASSVIVTPNAELADRCLVEIARGCPYRCRFCFIGNAACHRARPFEAIREMIERGRRLTNRFGLIAGAVGRHPEIDRICEYALREGLDVSFSSLRVEDVTPAMLDLLVAGGQRSVTIAPEAGSERLRRSLGKGLTDAEIIHFAVEALRRGLTDLRLYFMVGIPGEEPDDVDAIVAMIRTLRVFDRAPVTVRRGRLSIAVNVSVFVPKPHTPLANAERPSPAEIKHRLRRLGALLCRIPHVEFRAPSLALADAQRYLAWADRRALDRLIEAAQSGQAPRGLFLADEL
jgi:radical SAM superfamily enzyme YgiQ (UPF0313 family)